MAKVKFNTTPSVTTLHFSDLKKNESFRIKSAHSQGAVYRKVAKRSSSSVGDEWFAMEEATGDLFYPSASPVEIVDVEVSIATPKPNCYR